MKNFQLIASLALVLACTASTQAALFDVETKLTAADAAAHDNFGISVAVSGNTAQVGAPGDDNGGSGSGSVYLYDVTTGNQLAKLTALNAELFGSSVAISGNMAIVGATGDGDGVGDAGRFSGSAYLFDVATGDQLAKLTASDAAWRDVFGSSVAISGNTALVGAFNNDDAGVNSGSAYLFDVTTGSQLFKLTASDAAGADWFGNSVAISGNTAIVGAHGNDDAGSDSGSAYLFDVTTGLQLAKITASDAAAGDIFGSAVAISGNMAIIGAHGNDDVGSGSGSVYLFDVTTGNQITKLTATDAAAGDGFGYSVAISGYTALVGARSDDDGGSSSGSAYLFDVTTGNQITKLTAADAAAVDVFGRSVAISGNTALAGALGDDDGGRNSGSAYLFENVVPEPSTLLLGVMACLRGCLRRNR